MISPKIYIARPQVCGTCVHYRQHYVLSEGGRLEPLWYGHCLLYTSDAADPQPDGTCPHWEAYREEPARPR